MLVAYGNSAPIFDKVSYSVPSDSGGGAPQNERNMLHRIDYHLSDKTTIFGRYALLSQNEFAGFVNNSPYAGYDTGQTNYNNNAMLSVTHVWNPRLVSETKIAVQPPQQRATALAEPTGAADAVFQLQRRGQGEWRLRRPARVLGIHSGKCHPVRRAAERRRNLPRLHLAQG